MNDVGATLVGSGYRLQRNQIRRVVGRVALKYLFCKRQNVFKCKGNRIVNVVQRQETEIKAEHLNDYLFTDIKPSAYEGSQMTINSLRYQMKTISTEVNTTI